VALYDEPVNPELRALAIAAVHACNERVTQLEAEGRYIGTHSDLPSVKVGKLGFPVIRMYGNRSHKDYRSPFGPEVNDYFRIAFRDVPELAAFIDFAWSEGDLRSRMTTPISPTASEEARERYDLIETAWFVLDILDRARNAGGAEPTDEELATLYLEREPRLFSDELPVEIAVPIVGAKFEVDGRINIAEGLDLEQLSDDDQLARATNLLTTGVSTDVFSAATHAFVWTDYSIKHGAEIYTSRLSFYPTSQIDLAFAALRVAHAEPLGYAQIVTRPLGWVHDWRGSLPPVTPGVVIRRYPGALDSTDVLAAATPISRRLAETAGAAYGRLSSAPRQTTLAARRLNTAALRDVAEDALLDLCIGFEAMLGDQAEVTHKLAFRVAALSTLAPFELPLTPSETFAAMKRVYEYRSKLIHGAVDFEKKATFTLSTGQTFQTLDLARTFLRVVIAVLLDHSDFLDGNTIELATLRTPLSVKSLTEANETVAAEDD